MALFEIAEPTEEAAPFAPSAELTLDNEEFLPCPDCLLKSFKPFPMAKATERVQISSTLQLQIYLGIPRCQPCKRVALAGQAGSRGGGECSELFGRRGTDGERVVQRGIVARVKKSGGKGLRGCRMVFRRFVSVRDMARRVQARAKCSRGESSWAHAVFAHAQATALAGVHLHYIVPIVTLDSSL